MARRKLIVGVNDLASQHPDVAREWHPGKNGDLTPDQVSHGSGWHAWWQCNTCGHEWEARIHSRARTGTGCPVCAKPRQGNRPGTLSLSEAFPQIAAEWHPALNGDHTPEEVTSRSNRIVWWRCVEGHEWSQRVSARTRGATVPCQQCARPDRKTGSLAELHHDLVTEWHPTLNHSLDPGTLSPGVAAKVWWRCNDCGYVWRSQVASRVRGAGCPACLGRLVFGWTDLESVAPLVAAELDPEANDGLDAGEVLAESEKSVWWRCPQGHSWRSMIRSRVRGISRCPDCHPEDRLPEVAPGVNDLATLQPRAAQWWHPALNGDLLPSEVRATSGTRAWWLCPECDHEWSTQVIRRALSLHCPSCGRNRSSKNRPRGELFSRDLPEVRDWGCRLGRVGDDAQLWWISPPMTELAAEHAEQMPGCDLSIAIPSAQGVLIWGNQPGLGADGSPVVGAIWQETGPAVLVNAIVWRGSAKASGPFFLDLVESSPEVERLLVTSLLLADSPTVATTKRPSPVAPSASAPAQTSKPSEPAPRPAPEVVIVRVNRAHVASGTTGGGGKLTRRFWVQGHWKMQPYGPKQSLRKPIFVAAHLKGPGDDQVEPLPRVNVL